MKNKRETNPISLFPMFNILVCTLGVLIFMLGSVATLSIGVGKTITIGVKTYKGAETIKRPHYLEWDGTSLKLHPGLETVAFDRELRDFRSYVATYRYIHSRIAKTALKDQLERIREDKQLEYIILLVRPSGFDNLPAVRGYFEQLGIDLGYEPIDQDWHVRIR